jgi:hypothetical protein
MRKYSTNGILTGSRLLLLAAAGSLGGVAFAQAKSLPDAQVEANVLRALAKAPQLATQFIKTTTVYGTVTLTGSVSDEASRTLAENLASRAVGVQKVVDELTLSDGSEGNAAPAASSPETSPDSNQAPTGGQGSNPQLQSDGTMAPPMNGAQAAPEPGYVSPPAPPENAQDQQQGSPQQSPAPPPQPVPPQQQGSQQYPYGAPPQAQAPYGQPVYRSPYRNGYAQQAPPPYGAQQGGRSVTIASGALLRMRLNEGLTSRQIKPGAVFDGVVLNDVVADGDVAIPRGAEVRGTIVESHPTGAVGGKSELALQLTGVTLGGRSFPIVSDTWTHDGRDKTGQTVSNAIGLGAFGAIIGAIAGGGPGAAIGAAAGGGAGIGLSAAQGRGQVVIPAEAIIGFHLVQPATVTTVSQAEMDRLGYSVQQANLQRRQPPPPGYYGRPVYYPYSY